MNPPEPLTQELHLFDGGLIVTVGDNRNLIKWDDVTRILAYNLDRFVVSDIVLELERSKGAQTLRLIEDDTCFPQVLKEITRRFGCKTDHLQKLYREPFTTDVIVWWKRDTGTELRASQSHET